MAIQVNVISENNAFSVEYAKYCTVALPITACWGPGFTLPTANPSDSDDPSSTIETALENTAWSLFPAGPDGLESFLATYRGPSSNYRSTKDYSYFMALSLLNAGYAIQTCRLCPGTNASTTIPADSSDSGENAGAGSLVITAKYPGTFGNNLKVTLKKKGNTVHPYWNLIGYAVDANGSSRAVENLIFVFKPEDSTDTIVSIDELQSKFFDFKVIGEINEDAMEVATAQSLTGGADVADASDQTPEQIMDAAIELASKRYNEGSDYLKALQCAKENIGSNKSAAEAIRFNEWIYTYAIGIDGSTESGIYGIYDLLKDKINYNPQRIISPWDDQDILSIDPDYPVTDMEISPMALELMEVAEASRCATAYIDVPKSLSYHT